ncbi:uncharacterized protein C5orf49 [Denticeps clupeoides]|uniref:Uncharacterized protein n=1 Tax=Denticeps clupeoides TaxID=299321 RepID=A0AAY4E256_9TELE|nr:uncharacterized protein C5orf49 homolog [Denticeps clupeoides]
MDAPSQAKSQPLSTQSVFSFIPPRRVQDEQKTYFNCYSKDREIIEYDRTYNRPEGFDNKLHRDDREHAKGRGLDIHTEEISRPVAVLSSSEYGRRLPPLIDMPRRQFARVSHIRTEFFRKNGITQTVEEGYGTVIPA